MVKPKLLSRDDFREGCFKRDQYKCVFCDLPAQDAHHIIERKLFPDGGYYLDNSASLCDKHHRLAEETILSVEEVRAAAGIKEIVVPPGFDPEATYDKWGRMRFKYPRTYHFDWSLSLMNDDRRLPTLAPFEGKRVIVTEKMDGENTTLYHDGLHARSIDSSRQYHESRNWIKQFHASIAHQIPENWRICGENMFAKHSIYYDNLESYFYGFSIWVQDGERNFALDWDATVDFFNMLGIVHVPVLYDGLFDEKLLRDMASQQDPSKVEGYVCRVADEIEYDTWFLNLAKYVRAKHVNTDQHWMTSAVVPNKLKEYA